MRLTDYNAAERLIQSSRSKRRQSAEKGYDKRLRTVRINEDTTKTLNDYLFIERPSAENSGGIVTDWIFLNLHGTFVGQPLSYHNYLKILKSCAERCGFDSKKIRTHSGRSTKVMDVLDHNALNPEYAKSEIHIRELIVEYGYSQGENKTILPKNKKVSSSELVSEKDNLIAKLRDKNDELERECELLRGKLFLAMQK